MAWFHTHFGMVSAFWWYSLCMLRAYFYPLVCCEHTFFDFYKTVNTCRLVKNCISFSVYAGFLHFSIHHFYMVIHHFDTVSEYRLLKVENTQPSYWAFLAVFSVFCVLDGKLFMKCVCVALRGK